MTRLHSGKKKKKKKKKKKRYLPALIFTKATHSTRGCGMRELSISALSGSSAIIRFRRGGAAMVIFAKDIALY